MLELTRQRLVSELEQQSTALKLYCHAIVEHDHTRQTCRQCQRLFDLWLPDDFVGRILTFNNAGIYF